VRWAREEEPVEVDGRSLATAAEVTVDVVPGAARVLI
jgi:hypothetical protein